MKAKERKIVGFFISNLEEKDCIRGNGVFSRSSLSKKQYSDKLGRDKFIFRIQKYVN